MQWEMNTSLSFQLFTRLVERSAYVLFIGKHDERLAHQDKNVKQVNLDQT